MIFDDNLVSKGEAGGKEAAGLLWNSVTEYVHQNTTNLPSDHKIVTRIYANLKGLGDVCHKSGIIDHPNMIEEFARGFTGSKQLFDFVDVGMGKDRADDKISGEPIMTVNNQRLMQRTQRFSNYISMTATVDRSFLAARMIMATPVYLKMSQTHLY